MSEPKITDRFIGDYQIENIHISPGAGVEYSKLDLVGKIKSSDIDFANPVDESKLNLNYPTHPENSTLVLEENFALLTTKLAGINPSGHIYDVNAALLGIPVGGPSTEGVIVSEPYNKSLITSVVTKRVLVEGAYQIYARLSDKQIAAQPVNISGVEVFYAGSAVVASDLVFDATLSSLSWNGGAPVVINADGYYKVRASTNDYITVYATYASLPLLDALDSLSFNAHYLLGFFVLNGLGQELPVEVTQAIDVYYSVSKTLQSKSWEDFFNYADFSQILDVPPPHGHDLAEIYDVSTSATELNQALDGIGPSVTAAALTALTNGAVADSYHTHSSGIGAPSTLNFMATSGQTAFNLGISPARADVYIQGILQFEVDHYSILGNLLILAEPAANGERVIIKYWI